MPRRYQAQGAAHYVGDGTSREFRFGGEGDEFVHMPLQPFYGQHVPSQLAAQFLAWHREIDDRLEAKGEHLVDVRLEVGR